LCHNLRRTPPSPHKKLLQPGCSICSPHPLALRLTSLHSEPTGVSSPLPLLPTPSKPPDSSPSLTKVRPPSHLHNVQVVGLEPLLKSRANPDGASTPAPDLDASLLSSPLPPSNPGHLGLRIQALGLRIIPAISLESLVAVATSVAARSCSHRTAQAIARSSSRS
jgi:hypothetical protein